VIAGYEADVVALSLAPDVQQIVDAGLTSDAWQDAPDKGMVSTSVVVFDVRPGNPNGYADWDDLTADGTEILTPDPASSGGARWNLVSLWGSALRGYAGVAKDDTAAATTLMQNVLGNVTVFDKSARDSIQNFEAGNGDVAITYENEVLTAQDAGLDDEAVYPPSTVLIENPVAIVDKWVDEHCVRDVAEAFVAYLHTPEAKELYTDVGFLRSTDIKEAKKGGGQFPAIQDLFTVDQIGGWDALNEELFSDNGIATQAIAAGRRNRELAYQVFRKYMRIDNPKLLDFTYRVQFIEAIPAKPYPREDTIQASIEDLRETTPKLEGMKGSGVQK